MPVKKNQASWSALASPGRTSEATTLVLEVLIHDVSPQAERKSMDSGPAMLMEEKQADQAGGVCQQGFFSFVIV